MGATDTYRLPEMIQRIEAERDQARRVAVALEQEIADLRERLEFATWGIA